MSAVSQASSAGLDFQDKLVKEWVKHGCPSMSVDPKQAKLQGGCVWRVFCSLGAAISGGWMFGGKDTRFSKRFSTGNTCMRWPGRHEDQERAAVAPPGTRKALSVSCVRLFPGLRLSAFATMGTNGIFWVQGTKVTDARA